MENQPRNKVSQETEAAAKEVQAKLKEAGKEVPFRLICTSIEHNKGDKEASFNYLKDRDFSKKFTEGFSHNKTHGPHNFNQKPRQVALNFHKEESPVTVAVAAPAAPVKTEKVETVKIDMKPQTKAEEPKSEKKSEKKSQKNNKRSERKSEKKSEPKVEQKKIEEPVDDDIFTEPAKPVEKKVEQPKVEAKPVQQVPAQVAPVQMMPVMQMMPMQPQMPYLPPEGAIFVIGGRKYKVVYQEVQ